MPKPFRKPASNEEEIPDYAKEVSSSSSDEEAIPSYAKEIKKPEKSFFSKAVDAIKPSKSFKATGDIFAGKQSKEAGEKPHPDLEQRKDTNTVGFDQDKWSNIASKFPESWHGIPVRQPAAFLGSLAGTALETLSAPENIAAMGAGALKGGVEKTVERELPIRQPSRRIDTLKETTPQQDTVAVATTRDNIPRTAKNISVETGIPSPSVRRTLAEIKKKTTVPEEPSIKQSREIPYEEKLTTKSPTIEDVNLPSEKKVEEKAPKEVPKPIEIPGKGVKNPFEKKALEERRLAESPVTEERRSPTRSPNLRSEFFPKEDLATRQTQAPPVRQVNDRYTPEDLAEAKIETARLMKADIPRLKDSMPRGGGEVPDYAKEVSPAKQDVTEGFGGSGHPESPEYVGKVLNKAGKGEPGLSVEPVQGAEVSNLNAQHIVYRGKDGQPIAVAKIVQDINGKNMVMDLAADKSKGLLTGRAMKSLAGKLEELKATEPAGTISPDATNFLNRMKESIAKKGEANKFAESFKGPEAAKAPESTKTPETSKAAETPELRAHDQPQKPSMSERATSRLQQSEDAARERIKKRGTFTGGRLTAGLPADDLADFAVIGATKIAKGVIKFADWSAEMIKDFGEAIKPHLAAIFKSSQDQHASNSTKELLNSLIEAKGASAEQQASYKIERAERFKEFANTSGEGVDWAKKAMSTLKGEYEKVNPGEGLGLSKQESSSLFDVVKQSKLSSPEKARGIAALFKLMNGEKTLQPNEIDLLDQIFEKHLGKVSGPGAANTYDIKSGGKPITFSEAVSKTPDDFLTKLANFSSKTTRSVLGFHVPGTAISFHGFNEAIRNTMFGPDFNPFKAAGRFGQASYYLARPGKAAEFLEANSSNLQKAMEEGGLKASTGDIGTASMFKGENILTKGINALTSPKPLFGQVIPALKLKGYEGLLESLEKKGMPHAQAAKAAGEATNNIFGGLNLQELERNRNTQKLFRIAALAPDWLESNVRLGKGMFSAIKNPSSPESKVYLSGMMNFLGSYVALNVINAINNNGRFSFQNEVGHEFDIATGKDSAGRTRYFSPYGTAMDMVRIPLEIAHSAVEGNVGKAFSDMRSRASEPIQFMTDMMTNTDYAGRSLYDKTKFGKPIPPMTQGLNVAGDAASHFLPIGAEAGINLAQGKVSPEQFAAQVLQLPMKYKTPQRTGKLSLGKMKGFKS